MKDYTTVVKLGKSIGELEFAGGGGGGIPAYMKLYLIIQNSK